MKLAAALRVVEHDHAHLPAAERPRYASDTARQTLKYPGEIVLTDLLGPAMIGREHGLEVWDGREGRR